MEQIIGIPSFDQSIDVKEVIDWISDCFTSDPNKDLFVRRLLAINTNSLGIKYSDPPFNVNKKFTEKYIKELLNLNDNQIKSLSIEGIEFLSPKLLHFYIESGHNLRDKQIECNPYFKIFLKTYCRDDRLVSTSKPFVSKPLMRTSNPKWETLLDVEIPDSSNNSSNKSLEKIYRQEVCIEFWSKNTAFSCKRFLSAVFRSEFNYYLGSVCLKIGKRSINENFFTYSIPSTGLYQKLSLSNESMGSVTLKIIWGRLELRGQHKIYFNYHILLYTLSFKWHLNQLNFDKNKELFIEMINREELNYLTFFYMPALSLHNQHKLQSNLTSYEDSIIRRSVLINLMIKYSDQKNNFSVILAKILANEDIIRKSYKAWLSNTYIQTLNQIEIHFVIQLSETSKNMLNLLTTEDIESSQSVRQLFYRLKALRKYHRKYRDLKLKSSINQIIETEITKWIEKNLKVSDTWPQIISFLTDLSEHLREYWYRLESIIDNKKISIFEMHLKYRVKELIDKWNRNKEDIDLSDQILNHFLFITEFNEFFPVKTKTSSSSDLETSDRNETVTEETVKHIQQIRAQMLTQIRAKDSEKVKIVGIKLNDLRFSPFIRSENSENQKFWEDFDRQIFDHWIEQRFKSLGDFAQQLANTSIILISIEKDSNKEKKELISGIIATKFFFNTVSQLIFFSLAVASKHYWNFDNFRNILRKLCKICYQFCSELHKCYENMFSFPDLTVEEINTMTGLSLTLFYWNTLNVMQEIHLKTDLLELITDNKAILIRKLLDNSEESDKNVTEIQRNFNNPLEVKKVCKYIIGIAFEIESLAQQIKVDISNKLVQQLYEDIRGLIAIFPNEPLFESNYQKIENSIKTKIEFIIENISKKQTIFDIILILKTKGEKIFVNQLNYIYNLFKQLHQNKDNSRVEEKMKLTAKLFIQLTGKYYKFSELMTNFVSELKIGVIFQNDSPLGSEKIDQMVDYINKTLKEKIVNKIKK